ncbi:hypothetical protein M409DRAFT_23202 [Zasmidium cellare ATCC 36951]|uniref:Transcription factor domain-containing protein n=1 Tax=Zasmidium cellare ATCC 36951 TaxID=1080233 RepID=A0A6A6CH50_ZASCE|nr:uncharacterized protein M409DRAFT_23202 [Zasmidium cellare ATCC 36951]KAF2166567.1 hypothetical protein M409DRAFT_23202 [Zasmidium cellare ATCC 36951]
MHYFLNYAALDLSGYILRDLWNGFVLQASQSDPMVRQAVLAVSSAHLDRCSGMGLTSATSLASYQTSVNTLRNYMLRKEKPSPELVLLCCILLFTFDRLRGDKAAAAIHLQSAMSILKNARSLMTDDSKRSLVMSQDAIADLTHVLLRMDIEDTMPVLDRGPLLDLAIDSVHAYDDEPPPMKFFSPREFMEPWMETCHAVWTFIGRNAKYRTLPLDEIPPSVLTHRRNLQRRIKAWRAAYKNYISHVGIPAAHDLPPPSPTLNARITDAINALIIESHYFVIKSVLAEALPSPTTLIHPWDLIAEKMLQCGEKALALRHAQDLLDARGHRGESALPGASHAVAGGEAKGATVDCGV